MSRLIDADALLAELLETPNIKYSNLDLIQKIANAPTIDDVPKWIPCSERLPNKIGFYFVSVGAPHEPVRVYEYKPTNWYGNDRSLWKGNDGSYCFNWFVSAWMPLPEPYEPKEQDDE